MVYFSNNQLREERAHKNNFSNAMMVLAQKLLTNKGLWNVTSVVPLIAPLAAILGNSHFVISISEGP